MKISKILNSDFIITIIIIVVTLFLLGKVLHSKPYQPTKKESSLNFQSWLKINKK